MGHVWVVTAYFWLTLYWNNDVVFTEARTRDVATAARLVRMHAHRDEFISRLCTERSAAYQQRLQAFNEKLAAEREKRLAERRKQRVEKRRQEVFISTFTRWSL